MGKKEKRKVDIENLLFSMYEKIEGRKREGIGE